MNARRTTCRIALVSELLAAVVACAGAPATTVVAAPTAPPAPPRPAAWVASITPRDGRLRVLERAGGVTRVVVGPYRAELRGEAAALADATPLRAILAATRRGDRWWFATEDGAYLRAETFLGTLVRVATTRGAGLGAAFHSVRGLIVREEAGGGAWLGEGDAFTRLPIDGAVLGVSLLASGVGLAAVAPGRLLRTVDGGRTFAAFDLGAEAVQEVGPDPRDATRLLLRTTAGPMASTAGGQPAPFAGDEPPAPSISQPEARALRDALLQRHYAAIGEVSADDHVAWEDGTGLRVASGQSSTSRAVALPGPHCRVWPWGRTFVALAGDDGQQALYSLADDRWTRLRAVPDVARVIPSDDGRTLVFVGPCDGSPPDMESATSADLAAVCAFDGASWTTVSLPQGAHVLSAHSGRVLYESPAPDGEGAPPTRTLHIARIGARDADRALTTERPDATVRFAQFSPDGTLVGIAAAGGRSFAAIGVPDAPLSLKLLPEGAEQLAFATPTHGIAIGADLSRCWTTTDGALHWTPLSLPIDGDASSVQLIAPRAPDAASERARVTCTPQRCTVAGIVHWGAPSSSVARIPPSPPHLASTEPTSLATPTERVGVGRFTPGRWDCTLPAARPRDLARWTEGVATRRLAPGGFVEVEHRAPDATSGEFTFAWYGADGRGRFRGRARRAELPPLTPAAPEATLGPVHVARGFVLLRRCRRRSSGCELWVAHARRGLTRLLDLDASLGGIETVLSVYESLSLDDGGVAFRVSNFLQGRADVVIRLDADGQLTGRRAFVWDDVRPVRALAVAPEGPGLALLEPNAPTELTFLGLDPARPRHPSARLEPAGPAACAGASGPSLVSMDPDLRQMPLVRRGGVPLATILTSGLRTVYGVDARGVVCARGFQAPSEGVLPDYEDDVRRESAAAGGHLEVRVGGGGLEVVARGPSSEVTGTCARVQE